MQYVKRIPPPDQDLRASLIKEGWKKIKEPPNLVANILFSVPFMVLAGLLSFFIIDQFNPVFTDSLRNIFYTGSFSITIRLDYILFAYLLIFLHELIHAVIIPGFRKSDKTYFGIRPWGGFVFTTEKLGKSRFLLISLAPFLVLSVFLPVVLGLLGLLNGLIAFLVLLNAVASSVDLLNAFLILIQVPGGSTVVNNGFETYYN